MGRKKFRLYIILGLLYLLGIIYPFIRIYVIERFSFSRNIDPEFMSRLLTASSIAFGFSSLIVIQEKKPVEKVIWTALMISLLSILLSATFVIDVALGKGNAVNVILALHASLNINIISVAFLASYLRVLHRI